MKLIDILVMISKGELKEGTKIKIKDGKEEFTYKKSPIDDENHHLYNEEGEAIFENYYIDVVDEEVELIELDHSPDVGKMATEKIEELDISEIEIENFPDVEFIFTDIACKLNEVINKVNAQTAVLLAHDKSIKEINEQLDY